MQIYLYFSRYLKVSFNFTNLLILSILNDFLQLLLKIVQSTPPCSFIFTHNHFYIIIVKIMIQTVQQLRTPTFHIQYYQSMQRKFDVELVIKQLNLLLQHYDKHKQLSFEQLFCVLDQFCIVFKALNSFLGIAFSDVKDKVAIIRNNNQIFPGHGGFLTFVKMEMGKNIHILNGDNNKDKKAAKEFKKYNSTARNLLRMMWLLTFIRVTFTQMQNPKKSMSDILCQAYDAAFGQKHSWIIRKGAKIAIMASSDRKDMVEAVLSGKYDLERFNQLNQRFLMNLIPTHEILWGFYKENQLVDLQ